MQARVWGGRALGDAPFHKPLPDDAQGYGEAWEVADLPEGSSLVASGPLTGTPLHELRERWGTALTGPHHERFPLLVKLLDAQQDLSVQVHPGPQHVEHMARWTGARPKDEAWLILDAAPGAYVLFGVTEPLTPEAFAAAIERGALMESMRRVEVRAGDVMRVPPGTLHAICAGVILLEIQQPSDTTWRVFDYNRPGTDGKPRALHIEQAREVAHLSPSADPRQRRDALPATPRYGGHATRELIRCDAYTIEQVELDAGATLEIVPERPMVATLLDGAAQLHGAGAHALLPHHTLIAPALATLQLSNPTPRRATFIFAT
jgi:mannose-6-phosphate isomerase